MVELHLLAETGDLDPRVVGDELHGLVRAGAAATAAASGSGGTTAPAPGALAEAGERGLHLAPLAIELAQAPLQQGPGLIDCVRNPWHSSQILSLYGVTVT